MSWDADALRDEVRRYAAEHLLAKHESGRSRGGWGTKVHVVTDGTGVPLSVHVTPGQGQGLRHPAGPLMPAAGQ